MSATNRGAVRREADFYSTPIKSFEPIIPMIRKLNVPVFEPAQGDGRLVEAMQNAGVRAFGEDISTGKDFFQRFDYHPCIVTNPPFSLAQEFCDHAIKHADHVFMLLRLNFLGSQKRKGWWKSNPPSALFVLSERPDFTGGGGDACDYAWFYWGGAYHGIHHP